jgi:DivIVA domain-containing protein
MELTPQTLHAVEFREARRGGYNTRDVDDFLERVAAGVGQLHERLRELAVRADTAEARLLDTQRQLDEVQRRAAASSPAATAAPPSSAARISETDDTLRRTLVLAQRTADATIKEAKQEANRLLDEARAEASRARASAQDEALRGADQARASIEAELDGLVSQREALKSDLEVLNRHIDDQRRRIRAGIDGLRHIIDDDAQLAPAPVPPLADVDRPAAPTLPSRGAFVPGPAAAAPSPPAPEPTDAPDPEAGPPFALGAPAAGAPGAPGTHVAALQEPPSGPGAGPAGPEVGPPTQPMPFTLSGDAPRRSGAGGRERGPSGAGSGERIPWLPSELRTSVDDEPPPPAPVPPFNGADTQADTETRPSEWGRAVFGPGNAGNPENAENPENTGNSGNPGNPENPDTDRSSFG